MGWLAQGGCIFCAEELASQRRFFFWYLTENYGAPVTVARVGASLGFCPRHTHQLVGRAEPSTIGHIFEQIGRGALAAVDRAQSALSDHWSPPGTAAGLRPSQKCLACQSESDSGQRRVATLARELSAPVVRSAFEAAHPLCLEHLVRSWGDLGEAAAPAALRTADLLAAVAPDAGPTLTALRGVDLNGGERPRPEARKPVPEEPAHGWSAGLAELETEIESGGCPACARAEREQAAYLSWLAQEVIAAPYHRWAAAVDLCREHSWALLAGVGQDPAQPLWDAMRSQATSQLGEALVERSPSAPRSHRGRDRSGWVPPALRRERECPACRAYQAAGERICELLVLAVDEPSTNAAYGRSGGLCMHHLPLAVGRARNVLQAGILLQVARVRLAVLQWELAEASRRRGWDTRWEAPSRVDQSWRRAVQHLGGVQLAAADGVGP